MSIWDGHSAYTKALCSAVEKFISPEIAKKQRGQRETLSADRLIESVSEAGFRNVTAARQELAIQVPLATEFIPLHLGSMPIANAFQSLPDEEKETLIGDVADTLRGLEVLRVDSIGFSFCCSERAPEFETKSNRRIIEVGFYVGLS